VINVGNILHESQLIVRYLNATLIPAIFLVQLGNGYIPTTCLREILRELDDQLTNEELDMMIEEIDSDGSGTVDFDGTFSIYFFQLLIEIRVVQQILKQILK